MSCLQVVDCVKEKAGGGLIRGLQVQKRASGRGLLKQLLRRGALGFSVCCFGYFLNRFFGFCTKKLRFSGLVLTAVCGFSVF